jgi:hypothetical protein
MISPRPESFLCFVIPAKAGTQSALARDHNCDWVPAFAGMTRLVVDGRQSDTFWPEGDICRPLQSDTLGVKATLSLRKATFPAIKLTKWAVFAGNPVNLSTSILACP